MRPKNWASFQHYKDRRPPWIKLHRELIDNADFHALSGTDAKYLVLLWIVASDNENGDLPPLKQLAFRLHLSEKETEQLVSRLQHWLEGDASTVLAQCQHIAIPETETEKRKITRESIAEIYEAYPRKVGRLKALASIERALTRNGITPPEMLERVKAYAASRAGIPKDEERFTPHPATWFNDGRYYDEAYAPKEKQVWVLDDGTLFTGGDNDPKSAD